MGALKFAGIAVLLLCGAVAQAADVTGKVLIIKGTADLFRGGKSVAIATGSDILLGDMVRVGPDSSAQIRMSDASIIALRANTQFLVEDYQFHEVAAAEDHSFYRLLKGGIRTITGLIGRRNPSAYGMRVATATIGIRGTNLSALYCNGDCVSADGSKAADGVYGGVTEGRIVVANGGSEVEFAKDEYFYVSDANTPARSLLAPPPFLRDKLDGIVRTTPQPTPAPGAPGALADNTSAQTGGNVGGNGASAPTGGPAQATTVGNGAGDAGAVAALSADTGGDILATTSPSPVVIGPTVAAVAIAPTYSPSAQPTVEQQGLPINFSTNYALGRVLAQTVTYGEPCSQNCGTYILGNGLAYASFAINDINLLYPPGTSATFIQSQTEPDALYRTDAISWTASASLTQNLPSGIETFSKGASSDLGSYVTADGQTVTWGRYRYTDSVTGAPTDDDYSQTAIEHWLDAPPVTSLPTSGTFTYTSVGGTHPTDQGGNAGTVTNPGAWSVNFTNNTLVNTAPVKWTMPGGEAYTVNVNTPVGFTTTFTVSPQQPGPAGGYQTGHTNQYNTIGILGYTSCAGNGCAIVSAQLAPVVGAYYLGMGIGTAANTNSGTQATAQMRVYGRSGP